MDNASITFRLVLSEVNMQLIVRGEQTHVLDVAPTANVEALRAQLSLLEVSLFPLNFIPPMQTEALSSIGLWMCLVVDSFLTGS